MKILISVLICILAGCAATTRSDPAAFKTIDEGHIAQSDVLKFSECIMDGFDKTGFNYAHKTVRQQQRSDGYRVEAFFGTAVQISVDIYNDGRVKLLEASTSNRERKVFEACLSRFRK